MTLSFLLSLAAVVYQSYSYGAEQAVKVISFKPDADLEYNVPENYSQLEGCIHRTFKMLIDNSSNPKGSIDSINPMIKSFDAFNRLVVRPLKPPHTCQNAESVLAKVILFFKNPLYVACSLKTISEKLNNVNRADYGIAYFSLIKQHTVSYKGNHSGNYMYNVSDLSGEFQNRVPWPGDLILIIHCLEKQANVNRYKENLDGIMHFFKNNEKNNLYFRTQKNQQLDTDKEFDTKSRGKVIYVKDALAYLSYLQKDVNSWNLQAAVECFNNFTETGKMKNLPFWTLSRYQLTAGALILFAIILCSLHKKNKLFIK